MSAADDRDDDLDLGSLRAVLRSMPDEEPPARGLDALMAAARDKAAQMADSQPAREPWWQRVMALLRRPPMLALASVTVLVGGALLIANRKDELDVQPEVGVESSAAPEPAAATTPSSPPPPALEESAPAFGEADEGEAADRAASPPPDLSRNERAEPPARRTTSPGRTADRLVPRPRPKPSAPPVRSDAFDGLGEPVTSGAGDVRTEATVPSGADARPKAAPTRRPMTDSDASSAGGASGTIERMQTQALRAAQANDCETVRSILRKLAALDEPTARSFASNPRLSNCLVD